MSSRDILLRQRALDGLMRSHASQVNSIQRRVSRWPGAAQSIVLEPNSTFTPGINRIRVWHDAVSLTVPRGRWMVVAEATIRSKYITGNNVFWASLRLNGSDDASAEERAWHSTSSAGMETNLTSFSTFHTSNSSGVITLQVSECTNTSSPPIAAFHPTLLRCSIIARPN